MSIAWERLIRFVSTDGRTLRGEPILPHDDFDLGTVTKETKLQAKVISGEDIYDVTGKTKVTDQVVQVQRILSPLARDDVDILRCVGLNFAKHSTNILIPQYPPPANQSSVREAGRSPPPFPSIFFKPNTCIADHGSDVVIPKIAQDDQADYEGELCIVIGKDAKDVSVEDALKYVAAYTAGNDVSSRKLQRDPKFAGNVPQWGFSKGFDTYAPLGPALIRSDLIGDPKKLLLKTIINGEVRQEEYIEDLVFDCAYLISYLSSGTTLRKGSVIMTGTPGGVGAGLKPPQYLASGTKMQVSISKIGTLENGVVFA
jgi:2-keto-4-pentenoate hydratase/2-oxohepta-3-ene-1,7-dioic acid hydratase in catechol pathway